MSARTHSDTAEATARFVARFRGFERTLNGASATPFHALRRDALARFESAGLPTTRDEEWRTTNLGPVVSTDFEPVARPALTRLTREAVAALDDADGASARLVFVNGHYRPEFSTVGPLPEGAVVESLRDAMRGRPDDVLAALDAATAAVRNPFAVLNTAFLLDGAFVRVPAGAAIDRPVHVLFVAEPSGAPLAIHPRVIVDVGEGGEATVVETYRGTGAGPTLTNAVTEIRAAARARVGHVCVADAGPDARRIGNLFIAQARDSDVHATSVTLSGAFVRNDVAVSLDGIGAESRLDGLSLVLGPAHVGNHTTIEHVAPRCASRELYKGVYGGGARGVFRGRIVVRPDAQKTDARQANNTLLLSDDAAVDAKPQLEIFADDVKCTHGATVGRLDDEAAFYLRSRGIPAEAAAGILTHAFAGEIVDRIDVASLRDRLDAVLRDRLGRI